MGTGIWHTSLAFHFVPLRNIYGPFAWLDLKQYRFPKRLRGFLNLAQTHVILIAGLLNLYELTLC